jgi:xanthine dehydrogenase accessory factor
MGSENVRSRCFTLVRGAGEIASGVAHALHKAGFPVVLHDRPTPSSTRRRMAFVDAVFDGTATLSGLSAERVDNLAQLRPVLARRRVLPLTIAPFAEVLGALPWVAVIDARMRKHAPPEPQTRLAPLTIGLGPGFIAGESVTVAVETAWEQLGQILTRGRTLAPNGEPQKIAGVGRERFLHSPFSGTFRSRYDIGHWVTKGDVIAHVDETPLAAPMTGVLRGITRDGVPVTAGTKVIEVDPRGWDAVYSGIGERPFKVAESVLAIFEAVEWEPLLTEPLPV